MMKRRATKKLLLPVILILFGAGLMGFYGYKALRPTVPFEFLAGVRPRYKMTCTPYLPLGRNGIPYAPFRAEYPLFSDFATVRGLAEKELLARRFELSEEYGNRVVYCRKNKPGKSNIGVIETVNILKDVRSRSAFLWEDSPSGAT